MKRCFCPARTRVTVVHFLFERTLPKGDVEAFEVPCFECPTCSEVYLTGAVGKRIRDATNREPVPFAMHRIVEAA